MKLIFYIFVFSYFVFSDTTLNKIQKIQSEWDFMKVGTLAYSTRFLGFEKEILAIPSDKENEQAKYEICLSMRALQALWIDVDSAAAFLENGASSLASVKSLSDAISIMRVSAERWRLTKMYLEDDIGMEIKKFLKEGKNPALCSFYYAMMNVDVEKRIFELVKSLGG